MAIEIVADLEVIQPHSAEWHELRKLGIGGSDAGAVCGVSRWSTPYQVWAEKVNPSPVEEEENEPQRWGKLLEPVVRDEFAHRTGIEVHPFPRMVRNDEFPFMLANVDSLTGPANALEGVYEGKTTRFADAWEDLPDGSVRVPLDNMVQGMHYLAVLNLQVVHFACLVAGQTLRIATVERDEQLIADLVEIEEKFWQSVLDREPPEPTAGDVSTLKKRWQPDPGKQIALPPSFRADLIKRTGIKAEIKTLQNQMDEIDARIMAEMGDAEQGTLDGQLAVTWSKTERVTIDPRALRAAHPEIAAEFSKTSTSRRFLPKEIKP